jgi:hypothetical protein
VEEEELVVPARLSDRAADRVADLLLLENRFRIAVEDVRLAVRVPVRVAPDVVKGTAEMIRAALADRGDLQAARAPVFRLISLNEEF